MKFIYKSYWKILLILFVLSGCSGNRENMTHSDKTHTIYIGTYTSGESEGIYKCSFNINTGKLSGLKLVAKRTNPSFLAISPDKKTLFCVNETMTYNDKPGGSVSAFRISHENDSLLFINEQPSMGGAPCHIITENTGKFLLAANYMGGNVAVYPIAKDGSIAEYSSIIQHEGSGKNLDRQEAAHAHSVILGPEDKYVYVSDLGIDKIMIYRLDKEKGLLTPAIIPWAKLEPGAGPRHFTFHPDGEYAYGINELNSTITSFRYNNMDGSLTEIQTISTLPDNFDGMNSCADIHITPSGEYLYGSNRGHNSIVCYSIDKSTGKLTLNSFESTRGETPRNFSLDPSGNYLLVANQNTNTIVSFKIDSKSGTLNFTNHILNVPSPVCIKFLN